MALSERGRWNHRGGPRGYEWILADELDAGDQKSNVQGEASLGGHRLGNRAGGQTAREDEDGHGLEL